MYEIVFYKDRRGKMPVLEYIEILSSKKGKDGEKRADKILRYIDVLQEYGLLAGEPYIKHVDGDIYELRPVDDRILFAAWTGKSFVLLSHFVKKTQKTPRREIDKAKKLLKDFREREKDE